MEILEAVNGKEAMEKIAKYPVTCIITDIRMPLMDGLKLISECKKIREDILVVFLSAYPDFEYAQQAIRMGAVDYVVKPVNSAIVKNILDKLEQLEKKHGIYHTFSELEDETECFEIEKVMGMVREYIKEHYMEDLSRDDVASRFHFSPSYFSIMFKKAFDVTFSEYLTKVRMEKAAHLLIMGNDTISVVAGMTGYNDVKYFLRVFKKYFQCTPKDYRHRRT